jgi:hypothetical protein
MKTSAWARCREVLLRGYFNELLFDTATAVATPHATDRDIIQFRLNLAASHALQDKLR